MDIKILSGALPQKAPVIRPRLCTKARRPVKKLDQDQESESAGSHAGVRRHVLKPETLPKFIGNLLAIEASARLSAFVRGRRFSLPMVA
jgi:hypothetical protein